MPGPGGAWSGAGLGCADPPLGRLLLQVVRILLECILVSSSLSWSQKYIQWLVRVTLVVAFGFFATKLLEVVGTYKRYIFIL